MVIGEISPFNVTITLSVSAAFIASSINFALKPSSIFSPSIKIGQLSFARPIVVALLKIISYASIKNSDINMEIAEISIRSIIPDDDIIKITPKKIIESVASYYNVEEDEILGKSKQKNVAFPRQIAMYLCKTLTNMNFVMIAKALGNRDRTTVMYGVDKIMESIKVDASLKADIEAITKDINSL